MTTSLICTVCAHGHHLSCHTAACQCWCHDQQVLPLHEVSADVETPTDDREEGAA